MISTRRHRSGPSERERDGLPVQETIDWNARRYDLAVAEVIGSAVVVDDVTDRRQHPRRRGGRRAARGVELDVDALGIVLRDAGPVVEWAEARGRRTRD